MSATGSTALRVCLVEDDPDHAMIITRAIRQTDGQTQIEAVSDGEAALAWLRSTEVTPDLILLDINMAGLSGFEVLTQVKGDERLKHIPVVMLTSSELPADIARAYELGASGYISKPSYLHDLRAILGNTLLYWSVMKRHAADPRAERKTSHKQPRHSAD
jgi:CheY-like chemotaxis protein